MSKKVLTGGGVIVLAVMLVGSIMRAPITALPLMLTEIADALQVDKSGLGILTTIPLIMFMLISNFASKTMRLFGLKRALMFALLSILIGTSLRLIVTMPTMILGTIFVGIGIAHLNVFMPAFVAAYYPMKMGIYTSLYSFSMMLGTTIFSLITAPIATSFGWQAVMWLLVILPILVIAVWFIATKSLPDESLAKRDPSGLKKVRIWTNPVAWAFLIVFGLQAMINYTAVAWLPSLMAYHGLHSGAIGFEMALLSLIAMPISIFLPTLMVQVSHRTQIIAMWTAGAIGLLGGLSMFFQNTTSTLYWAWIAISVGIATAFFFVYIMTMFAAKTTNADQTARLSGMAQTGGYLLAAIGPMVYGWAFKASPTGNFQTMVYITIVVVMTVSAVTVARVKHI
jgi:CP family cyanate transporter-like MFS transporter